ncbi:MAG TPA: hypothetical protein VHZ74_03590 [Bryobacteraceae bacterium]|nr:hypothetical protein [Bryobacteraceae bacterium]
MAKRPAAGTLVQIGIQIERWPIERLIPRADNPPTHSREQVAHIEAWMREWGWANPILVGADDDIIRGATHVCRRPRSLGMKEIPVILLSHLSPSGARSSSRTMRPNIPGSSFFTLLPLSKRRRNGGCINFVT